MRTLLAALLVAGTLLTGASSVGAARSRGPMGLVPHAGSTSTVPTANENQLHADGSGPLVYQGGKVMETNTVYAIYWMPSGSTCNGSSCTGYRDAINQYFTDVAADSGHTSNVYSVATQYCQGISVNATSCGGGGTPISYNSTFGGFYLDTTPYPVSGCNDSHGGNQDATCLTDAQLEQEIVNDIGVNSWPEDTTQPSHLYFIFTPSTVGICSNSSNSSCSTNVFCAYHDNFLTNGSTNDIAYAVEPDNATIPGGGCDSGEEPNNTGADPTINTSSHEMNEAITDPWPETSPGWWTNDGSKNEIGDLCVWDFGTAISATGTGQYNQVINGNDYWLQQEYSNDGAQCLQRYTPAPPPPPPSPPSNTGAPAVSGTAAVGRTLTTSNGSWSNSPTGFSYEWEDCSAGGASCATISGATGASYALTASDAGFQIRSEVSARNDGGSSALMPSTPTDVVVPVPAVTVAPAVSGVAAVGKTLSTTQGTWNTPVTVTYEWLRCIGTSCGYIPNAQAATYQATAADAGHTLEARLLATNAAGTTAALTAPTVAVIDIPKPSMLPHIRGTAKVGKKLAVANGAWTNSPTSFDYQWFRCSAKSNSCTPIAGAEKSTYKLTKKDAKHRLRVQVSAVNAAGKTSVRSAATKTVQPTTTT